MEAGAQPAVQLQKLSPAHKQVVALLVQGVPRATIAELCEFTPEYISWLSRQPLCQAYFRELSEFADIRLAALSERSVDVLADAMQNGTHENALRAAKLQMEATGRIGRFKDSTPVTPSAERLATLGARLLDLLKTNREKVIEHENRIVSDQ